MALRVDQWMGCSPQPNKAPENNPADFQPSKDVLYETSVVPGYCIRGLHIGSKSKRHFNDPDDDELEDRYGKCVEENDQSLFPCKAPRIVMNINDLLDDTPQLKKQVFSMNLTPNNGKTVAVLVHPDVRYILRSLCSALFANSTQSVLDCAGWEGA
jgi:hypothetical protein